MATVPPLLFDDGTAVLFDDDEPVEQFFGSPRALHPAAWYDADLGASASAVADSSGNGQATLAFAGGTNSPTWLDYGLGAGAIPDGSAFNHVRLPTTGTPSVTYDGTTVQSIEWRVRLRLPSLPAASCYIAGTSATHGALRLGATGLVAANYTNNSSGVIGNATSTSAITFTANQWIWLRAKVDVYSASAPCDYYWSTDDTDDHAAVSWTSLGTSLSTGSNPGYASTGVPTRSAALAGVLGFAYSTGIANPNLPYGSAVRCVTTLVVPSSGAAAHVRGFGPQHLAQSTSDSSVNPITGATHHGTVTVGRSTSSNRKTVVLAPAANSTRDVVVASTDDRATVGTIGTVVPAATAGASCTLAAVIRPWATQAAGAVILTTRTATSGVPGVQLRMAGTSSIEAIVTDGSSTATTPAVSLTLGARSVVGVILAGGSPGTARCFVAANGLVTLGSTVARTGNTETGGGLRVFADTAATPANHLDIESTMPAATFPVALTEDDLLNLLRYYDGGILDGLDPVTGNLTGTLTVPGSIASTLDPATGDLAGLVGAIGALASTLADTTGDLAGLVGAIGALASTLDPATGDMAGLVGVIGQLDAALADSTGDLAGLVGVIGQLDAALADIAASMAGTVAFDGTLGATVGPVTSTIDDLLVGINRLRATFRERTRATYREV